MSRSRSIACVMALLALFWCRQGVWADLSDIYFDWSSLADQIKDDNTGLTVLNSLLVPMGGSFEGMGTAYTAVSDDTGYIESNPAASSRLEFTELALSHHDWISDVSLDSVVYTMRFKDLGFGVAGKFLPISFTRYDGFGEAQSKAYITESTLILNASYNFGAGYSFEGVSAGANVKLAYRGIPPELVPELPQQSAVAAMADIGVLTRFNFLKTYVSRDKNFSVGLTLKNLGPLVMNEPLPTILSGGVAYSPIRPLTVSADLNIPINLADIHRGESLGFALGLRVKVADFLSVQTGFWWRGRNPRLTLGATVDLKRTSVVVNSMLDLSGLESFYDKLSVEARVNLGDMGRAQRQKQIDDLFVSAVKAYAAGDYERSIELAQRVTDLQPNHEHAIRLKELANATLEARAAVRRVQPPAAGTPQDGQGGTAQPGAAPATDEGLEN